MATFDGRGTLRVVTVPGSSRPRAGGRHLTERGVEIAADQDAGDDDRRLAILIEKDFECLHGERSDDAFPNPQRGDAAAESTGIAGT